MNILLNILKQRKLISHEQKWDDRKTVSTTSDDITFGTEHWRSEAWKEKGRVVGAKLKPGIVWLRYESGEQWKKVVDVKVTSTDKLNETFKKNREIREWTMAETPEK